MEITDEDRRYSRETGERLRAVKDKARGIALLIEGYSWQDISAMLGVALAECLSEDSDETFEKAQRMVIGYSKVGRFYIIARDGDEDDA